jgi:hypothetical protein
MDSNNNNLADSVEGFWGQPTSTGKEKIILFFLPTIFCTNSNRKYIFNTQKNKK